MEFISCKDAAEIAGVSRQQICSLTKFNRVEFLVKKGRLYIEKNSLDDYIKNKYSRDEYFADDEMSIKDAAKELGVSVNKMYYLVYKGFVHYRRIGSLYIINKADLQAWKQAILFLSQLKSTQNQIDPTTGQKNMLGEKRLRRL